MRPRFSILILVAVAASSCSRCSHRHPEETPNTVLLSSAERVTTLDPALAEDLYSLRQTANAYESLFQYDYLEQSYSLIPLLADSMPEVSDGGKTYLISIKKGILFQDDPCFQSTGGRGRELTAGDFVYSMKRIADPAVNSPFWRRLDGRIAGLSEWRKHAEQTGRADYSREIEGLRAVNRFQLRISLTHSYHELTFLLAMPFTSAVPREAVEYYSDRFGKIAVGTGPYRYDRQLSVLSEKLVWDRSPTFRVENAGPERLPLNDRVVVRVIPDPEDQWKAFLSGALDVVEIPKAHFNEAVTASKGLSSELKDKGFQLIKAASFDVSYEAFNLSDPLIGANRKLRQAISMAYQSAPLIDLLYDGAAVAAQSPLPPGMTGYNPKLANPYRQFDLARARQLLAEAGFPEGAGVPPLVYLAYDREGGASRVGNGFTAEYVSKTMAQLGIKLDIRRFSWPRFVEEVRARRGQLWTWVWSADYPDPENVFELFYSGNIESGENESAYRNPEFDRLFERAESEPDTATRLRIYQEMEKILIEDCPWIWGVHRIRYRLLSPRLRNYYVNDFDHGFVKYLKVTQ